MAPGDKIEVIQLEGRIELIPVRSAKSLKSFLKGRKNTFQRENDRRLPKWILLDGLSSSLVVQMLTGLRERSGMPRILSCPQFRLLMSTAGVLRESSQSAALNVAALMRQDHPS
jgi:hypothetical protein